MVRMLVLSGVWRKHNRGPKLAYVSGDSVGMRGLVLHLAVASEIQKFNRRPHKPGGLARLFFATFGRSARSGFTARKDQQPCIVSLLQLFYQKMCTTEFNVVRMCSHGQDIHR